MFPSPEEAWLQGRAAGADGRSGATNPFSAETELALDWMDGWLEGTRNMHKPMPHEETNIWAVWKH
jgi:ribosome modulation factor